MIKLYKGDNKIILPKIKSKKDEFNIVYLDPPYNTKNGNMSYLDDRKDTWLKFFKDRLKLIKDVLEDDAVIYTSIGHEELGNAKLVLDNVFGKKSFVAIMPRMTNNVSKTTKLISRINDFVIINKVGSVTFHGKPIDFSSYKFKDKHFDKRGFYQLRRLDYKDFSYSKTLDFAIDFKNKKYYPNDNVSFLKREKNWTKKDWCWLWSKPRVKFAIKNNYLETKNGKLFKKTYTKCEINKNNGNYLLFYGERKQPFSSFELFQQKYTILRSKKEDLTSLFTYPKNNKLLRFLFKLPKFKNKKVLDPFAGTGISGIICREMNIRCTLIQIDETVDEKSMIKKANFNNIFDLTKTILKNKIGNKLKVYE